MPDQLRSGAQASRGAFSGVTPSDSSTQAGSSVITGPSSSQCTRSRERLSGRYVSSKAASPVIAT